MAVAGMHYYIVIKIIKICMFVCIVLIPILDRMCKVRQICSCETIVTCDAIEKFSPKPGLVLVMLYISNFGVCHETCRVSAENCHEACSKNTSYYWSRFSYFCHVFIVHII